MKKEIAGKDLKIIEKTLAWAIGILAFQIDGSLGSLPKMSEDDKKDALEQLIEIKRVYNIHFDAAEELKNQIDILEKQ